MAITIGSTAIKGLYLGSNTIKAACMGVDSNKIYPVNVGYSENGYGDYYIAIPATGRTRLVWSIRLSEGANFTCTGEYQYTNPMGGVNFNTFYNVSDAMSDEQSGELQLNAAMSSAMIIFRVQGDVAWEYNFSLL